MMMVALKDKIAWAQKAVILRNMNKGCGPTCTKVHTKPTAETQIMTVQQYHHLISLN